MEIIFTRPEWLGLFLVLPLLLYSQFFVFRHLKRRAFLFANFEALKRVTGQGFVGRKRKTFISKNLFLLFLRMMAFSMLILAVAGIAVSYNTKVIGGNFVIALDTSSSMLADDYEPNRITAAKEAVTLMLTSMGARMKAGLVTFAGVSHIEQPITDDRKLLMNKVANVSIQRAGGTNIPEAIITSVNLLVGAKGQKTVILITDGRSTVGSPLEDAVSYAKEKNVAVDTVGIATKSGGSFLNIESLSTLDEPTLKMMANETGGEYFHAETPKDLVFQLEGSLETQKTKKILSLSWWFVVAGFAILLVEWLLFNIKYRSIP